MKERHVITLSRSSLGQRRGGGIPLKTILGLLGVLLLAAVPLGVLSVLSVEAQEPIPIPTTDGTIVLEPTALPGATLSPTVPPPAQVALMVTGVEPNMMLNDAGGTLSIYGAGFTSGSAVRLIGYGLLVTSPANPTALTAQVPAGIPAGAYDVEVSDGVQKATLSQALTILAPKPTPKPRAPAPPPPPGRPILTIRNYAVEPARVRVGEAFDVTIEIYNNGSRAGENTMAVFPGDSFLPVGEPGHMIGQIHINHVAVITQRMRASSNLTSGVYQLAVNVGANDWEGNHYDYPQSVPVEVIGGGGATGKPKVVIEAAGTEPPVLGPGDPFTLTLRLANRGSRTASDVFIDATSSDIAIPAAGGGTASIERIAVGEGVTVTLPLLVGDVGEGGRHILSVAMEYGDSNGGAHTDEQKVSVDVDAGLSRRPQLVIAEYATVPAFLTPGDTFTLTARIENVGGGDAERVTLALGGEGGAHLEPFIPLQAGNVMFVPSLEAGSSTAVTRRLAVDGAADPKAYSLPIALAYDDTRGTRDEDIQRLSLVVRRRAELQATFYREPEALTVDSPTALSLEMLNVGVSAVNVVQVTASSRQMEVQAAGTPFVGPVEMGGSAPLDVTVTPREGGTAELVVTVTYRDDFNQLQVLTRTLTLEVTTSPAGIGPAVPGGPGPASEEETVETVWRKVGRAIRGFLGFGS